MATEIITHDDLMEFKCQLLAEFKELISTKQPNEKRWLRSREVLEMLNISHSTLQSYRINGLLQYTKVGKTFFYDYVSISKTLKKNSS